MQTPTLLRTTLLSLGLLLAAGCSAQSNPGDVNTVAPVTASSPAAAIPASAAAEAFTEGNEYVRLPLSKDQVIPTGPLEVLEVFSYGCPHCAEFAPYMDKLQTQLPAGTQIGYMPAVFNASWVPYAQAYYAAKQLGVLAQTHDALFKAMLERYPLNSLQDLAAFYARHGVDQDKFLTTANNAKTTAMMAADRRTEAAWGIAATPTLVVGRRANNAKDAPFVGLMRSDKVDSYAQLQQVGLWMAQHVKAN